MKTKHILSALVLPAMFAACTADDIEGLNNMQQPERAVLSENFNLNFGGVESRLTAGEPDGAFDFEFETNDVVGGAIVDAWNGSKFAVVNYVSTNHPFVKEGSKWTIEHTMVEGNYLFYYPYNAANNSRGAVVYEIPVMQDLSDAEGNFNRKAAIEKYSTAVGITELEKTDLSANVELKPINSYARIVAKFDNRYAGGEVEKVVLQTTANAAGVQEYFTVKGQISNIKLNNIEKAVLAKTKEWSDVKATSDFTIAAGESFYNDELTGRTSTVLVGKVPAGVKMKVDAQNNKSFETYMLVPAQSLTNAVKVYLYLTDGRVFVGSTKTGITFNRHTPKKLEVEMDEAAEVPFVITSMKDWNLYASEVSKNTTAVFEIANPDFVLTEDAKFPTAKGAKVKVTTDLTIAGDVTLKNVVAEGTIIVAEGAKLTTDASLSAVAVENHGEVVVAPVKDEDGDYVAYETLQAITNKPGATLEIAENAIVKTSIVNEIDVKDEDMAHGVVTVNGTAVLLSGSTNAGEVVNNGSMTGAFTNQEKQAYSKNAVEFENVEDYIYFTPSITNNGEIFATAAWTNKGLINNAKGAEISVSKIDSGAKFTNNGTIKLADGSFCLISVNENGEIILAALNQENWTVADGKGVVAYTTGAADAGKSYDFTTTGKNITKIYLNGSLGFTKVGKVNNLVVTDDATISMPAEGTIANLTVKAGVAAAVKSATVSNVVKTANFTNVTVEKGATLTVNEGHALQCANVYNAGTVYVGGSFNATETLANEAGNGKFKTTSTTGNISFGGQTDAQKKEAEYKAALKEYVSVSIDNANLSIVNSWTAVETFLSTQYVPVEAVLVKANAMIAKYNSWKGTNKDQSDTSIIAVANEGNSSYLKAAIASLKTAADATVKAAIQAKVKDNSWIGTAAYVKAEEDASVIEIMNGSTALNDAFAAYIATLSWDIKSSADETAEDYEVTVQTWLSIKGITADRYYDAEEEEDLNMNEIPEYSFINTYKTSMEFKMMKLWIEVTADSNKAAWYVNDLKNKIQSPATVPYIAEGFMTFVNEAYKLAVSDEYKNDLQVQKILGELKTNASTIINWEYTGKQYYALYLAVTAAN